MRPRAPLLRLDFTLTSDDDFQARRIDWAIAHA